MSLPSIEEYYIGWICALPKELTAARAMLDKEYETPDISSQDDNSYVLGRIGEHNIVMACLPTGKYGTNSAATVTNNMRRTFTEVRFGLMVGIGGGIPNLEKGVDIRLGDIVVSEPDGNHGGVIQYDLGKNLGSGNFELKGALPSPPARVLTALSNLRSRHDLRGSQIPEILANIRDTHPDMVRAGYTSAGLRKDVLFCSHSNTQFTSTSCHRCENGRIQRERRLNQNPVIHYGVVASGNSLIKNVVERDRLGKELGAKCIEMEAAGVMNDFPCIVIRGICDYADAHKNDAWQNYAATTAAAFARELVLLLKPNEKRVLNSKHSTAGTYPVHWMVPRATNTLFTGRGEMLAELNTLISNAIRPSSRPNPECIVITAIGGQGKSELCLQLALRTRQLFWGIFWIDVSTNSLAENGFCSIANRLGAGDSTWEAGRQTIANLKEPWLLVLDNADDPSIDLHKYLPSGGLGVVVITSRNTECKVYATMKAIDLTGLNITEAQELLLRAASVPDDQKQRVAEDAYAVAGLLNSHALALVQAGSYIGQGHCSFKEYPKLYQEQRKRLLEFRPSQAQSRYKDVYATFEASARVMGQSRAIAARDALELLPVLAMYGPNRVPILLLCRSAWQYAQRWRGYKPHKYQLNCVIDWHISRLLPLIQADAVAWDPFRLKEALHLLQRFSLLSSDDDPDNLSVSMHPLVHAWAKDRLSTTERHECWIKSGCIIAVSRSDDAFWAKHARQLQPHLQSLLSWDMAQILPAQVLKSPRLLSMRSKMPESQKGIVSILLRSIRLLVNMRDDVRVFSLMEELQNRLNLEPFVVKNQWTDIYSLIAYNMILRRKLEDAVTLLKQINNVHAQTLAEDHPKRLTSQHNLASAYRDNGQVEKVVALLEHVVKIQDQTLAEDHPERLSSQHALAIVYRESGQVEKAVALLEHVVKIRGQTLAEDHPDRLVSQYALAIVYRESGQVEKAVMLLEHVVKIQD